MKMPGDEGREAESKISDCLTLFRVMGMSIEEGERVVERMEEGKSVAHSCYMCGKSASYSSAHLKIFPEQTELYEGPEVMLARYRRIGRYVFEFILCFDCTVLLEGEPIGD